MLSRLYNPKLKFCVSIILFTLDSPGNFWLKLKIESNLIPCLRSRFRMAITVFLKSVFFWVFSSYTSIFCSSVTRSKSWSILATNFLFIVEMRWSSCLNLFLSISICACVISLRLGKQLTAFITVDLLLAWNVFENCFISSVED